LLNVTDDEWFAMRNEIESRRLEFINTSRHVLGRSGPPLKQILGRPAEFIPRTVIGVVRAVGSWAGWSGLAVSVGRHSAAAVQRRTGGRAGALASRIILAGVLSAGSVT
jgi:hypothetical protein